jgi:ABC-type polysaccharide/polyol phosphate transport system ATPase subunit
VSAVIRFDQVSKKYRLHADRPRAFTQAFVRFVRGQWRAPGDEFWALRDVSFEIPEGQMVGVIGPNGSGKTTALKLMSSIMQPTLGRVEARASVAGLIGLGAGFHPDLTGRENVYLNGSLMGLSRRTIDRRFDDIVAFAEIGEFIDVQLRRYSTGMQVRLGFAVAVSVDAEIVLADEVLAVGDEAFQRKCLDRIRELRAEGRTIVFVSHDVVTVERMCDRVLVLSNGRLVEDGPPASTVQHYHTLMAAPHH